MKNVEVSQKNGKLLIEIDTSANAVKAAMPSSTGKTKLLATTNGSVAVDGGPDGLKFQLNVMIPN